MTAESAQTGSEQKRPTGSLHPGLTWRDWWYASKAVFMNMNDTNLGLISAGVAFYGMLALFPAVAALIAIWGFIADPSVVESQMILLRKFIPTDAFVLLDDQVTQLVRANTRTLGWATLISTGAALWSSRAGVAALIRGLNAIYRERNRVGLRQILAAFGVTFLLIFVAIIALTSVVIMPIFLAVLPLGPLTNMAISTARWLIVIAVVMSGLGVIYRYGPNRRHARSAWLTPGALLAVAIWAAASYGFSYYLTNFGRYNEIYGALGAVIALLMWLYISAFVVLLGASLNVELEMRTAEDSTVGPDRPMGERGAVAADTLAPDSSAALAEAALPTTQEPPPGDVIKAEETT
ncbi:YihY/virulence factor BrkB family protein [Profundibacterium mesophilum]|uniref:Ribonuclease BN n=1 Tax=Profundibacterium mesophilum KAUST100406-0324 TaxID=1037889 RepID=A0A921NV72_9RHOB|nr:YihY/virulence factor BrkB family protein [Profundibacterium mesophilum]KAF0677284.1 Ribonuclease BN [Profundibacterium mesophilum KAUST100406-0324]